MWWGTAVGGLPSVFLSPQLVSDLFIFQFFSFFKKIYLLAALGLCCCTWAFSSCGEQGLLLVAVHRLLVVVASLVAEHRP